MQQISIDASLHRANNLLKKGKASDALKIVRRIQIAFPGNERARTMLDKLCSDNPINPPMNLLQPIINNYAQSEFRNSLHGAENLSKNFPNSPILHSLLGAVKFSLGQIHSAELHLRSAVELDPFNEESINNLARALRAQKKYAEAIDILNSRLPYYPNSPEMHNILGGLYVDLHDLQNAIECFKKANKLDPTFADAFFNLGGALFLISEFEEAIKAFEKAKNAGFEKAKSFNNICLCQRQLGCIEDAIISCKFALKMTGNEVPEAYSTLVNLGNAYSDQKNWRASILNYDMAIKCKNDQPEAYINLGKAHASLKEHSIAIRFFEQALKIEPSSHEAEYEMGLSLAALGKFVAVGRSFDAVLEIIPTHIKALIAQGINYKKIENYELAKICFESAIKQSPEDQHGAFLHLASMGFEQLPNKTPDHYLKNFYREKAKVWGQPGNKGYRGHKSIAAALTKIQADAKVDVILDMGCGTGSLGTLINPFCRSLVGVDISADMLARASESSHYDILHEQSLGEHLFENTNKYDTIIAAAVLIHFNDLDPIFSLVKSSLVQRGVFIFSIFESDSEDVKLNSLLMYEHNQKYISKLAEKHDFEVIFEERALHEKNDKGEFFGLSYGMRN